MDILEKGMQLKEIRLWVKDIRLFNMALWGKWIWQLGTEKDSIRKKIPESLWWRDIRKIGWMKERENCSEDNTGWKIGNRKIIKVW